MNQIMRLPAFFDDEIFFKCGSSDPGEIRDDISPVQICTRNILFPKNSIDRFRIGSEILFLISLHCIRSDQQIVADGMHDATALGMRMVFLQCLPGYNPF